jgi:protein-disulfide isomerase
MSDLQAGRARGQARARAIRASHPVRVPAFPDRIGTSACHARRAGCRSRGGQGKFWQMHDLLFDNQRHLKMANLREYAQRLDLDMPRFIAEMDDEIYLQRVREQMEGGSGSHVRGTPTFYINGVIHDVSFGMHALMEGVEAALKRGDR